MRDAQRDFAAFLSVVIIIMCINITAGVPGYTVNFIGDVVEINHYDLRELGLEDFYPGNVGTLVKIFMIKSPIPEKVLICRPSTSSAEFDLEKLQIGDRVQVYGLYPSTQITSGPYMVELTKSRHYLRRLAGRRNNEMHNETPVNTRSSQNESRGEIFFMPRICQGYLNQLPCLYNLGNQKIWRFEMNGSMPFLPMYNSALTHGYA